MLLPQSTYLLESEGVPDLYPLLSRVDVTTPIHIFVRGGAGLLSLIKIVDVPYVGCGASRPGWGEDVETPMVITLWRVAENNGIIRCFQMVKYMVNDDG